MLFLSELINYQGESRLIFAEHFNHVILDYSLESLDTLDEYLLKVNQYYLRMLKNVDALSKEQQQQFIQEIVNVVLRIGAYVGETIREHDHNKSWYWIRSKKKRNIKPILVDLTQLNNDAYSAILTDGTNHEFPMSVVTDLIGDKNQIQTVHFYVHKVLRIRLNLDCTQK